LNFSSAKKNIAAERCVHKYDCKVGTIKDLGEVKRIEV
jgi:hypothetical protein